ncbi:hypothetical protein V6U90_29000 [Micromonospora sp. CPCC 206060]|uniref:Acg family FMN-binding oxidoreductase n=1 Tax=Micromonospora sp. CPCC 206060 TaxID=3122406 RepID=UPI002FF41B35
MLHAAGVGALMAATAGAGLLSYRAYDNRVLGADRSGAFDGWRRWRDEPGLRGLVAAASLAASPHNTQPWSFHLGDNHIDVYADDARRMGSVDPYARELRLGLGCALENLVLAGQARGFDPQVTLCPDTTRPDLAARVDLPSGAHNETARYRAIGRRHTNRGPYRRQPISDAILAELTSLATGQPTLAWITSEHDRLAMGQLMVEAAQAVTADTDQSRDGFAWFRASADAINAHKDGLTLDGQGLSSLVTAVAKLLPSTSRAAGDAFWVDQTRTVHTRTAAAYGLILVPDPRDPVHQLDGGRLLQRIHLEVTVRGLALQHMNQITERIDRDLSLGRSQTFGPRLAALVGRSDQQVLTAFRLGHPVREGRRSPRRPAPEVLR